MRKPLSAEAQQRSLEKKKAWALLSPETRKEREAKRVETWKRNQQLRAIKDGRLRGPLVVPTFSVDEDFDEGF